jgi:hypothetical protein
MKCDVPLLLYMKRSQVQYLTLTTQTTTVAYVIETIETMTITVSIVGKYTE